LTTEAILKNILKNHIFYHSKIHHIKRSGALRIAGLCVMAAMMSEVASAAEWNVDPVLVKLSSEQQSAAIIIRNDSDHASSIQIQVVAWSQLNGKDVYVPTRDLVVSPPIATIPPKSDQVVRVALRRTADTTKELMYRINLQELPPQQDPGFTGVQVALRIGLPVFVQPLQGNAKAKMHWQVSRAADNHLKVVMQNQGNAHVKVSDFSLYSGGSTQAIGSDTVASYVLPGQSHEWLLKPSSTKKIADGRLHLKAFTDAENIDTELDLGKP
jgi:fimbrial chaperone protein